MKKLLLLSLAFLLPAGLFLPGTACSQPYFLALGYSGLGLPQIFAASSNVKKSGKNTA